MRAHSFGRKSARLHAHRRVCMMPCMRVDAPTRPLPGSLHLMLRLQSSNTPHSHLLLLLTVCSGKLRPVRTTIEQPTGYPSGIPQPITQSSFRYIQQTRVQGRSAYKPDWIGVAWQSTPPPHPDTISCPAPPFAPRGGGLHKGVHVWGSAG